MVMWGQPSRLSSKRRERCYLAAALQEPISLTENLSIINGPTRQNFAVERALLPACLDHRELGRQQAPVPPRAPPIPARSPGSFSAWPASSGVWRDGWAFESRLRHRCHAPSAAVDSQHSADSLCWWAPVRPLSTPSCELLRGCDVARPGTCTARHS